MRLKSKKLGLAAWKNAAIFCLVAGLAGSNSAIAQQKLRMTAKVEIIAMPDKSAKSYFERRAPNPGPEIETAQKKQLVDKCCKMLSNASPCSQPAMNCALRLVEMQ